jgi:formylglycine-generating enzyme
LAPVGTATRGVGRWGQLDLTGNVAQWNLDMGAESFVNPCIDCANLPEGRVAGANRMARGSAFDSPSPTMYMYLPPSRSGVTGFRCARVP